MAKFNELYNKLNTNTVHVENIDNVTVNTEGIIDNIVNWVKGEKLVAYSRFKYMNQFCKTFEDPQVNHGLWGFFMPKAEGYVTKLGMYALGKSASQAMNQLVKSVKLDAKSENRGISSSYNNDYDSNINMESINADIDKVSQAVSDFESFSSTINRNASVMEILGQPIELTECRAIIRVLHRLQGVSKADWLDPIEYAEDKMKNDPNFFTFKAKLKPLRMLADKMEQFRAKWLKFILDEIRFEERKTRGVDA